MSSTAAPQLQPARVPESGAAERKRLRNARVLIVGVGGLGSPAALWLAKTGVGTLGLVDGDVVELSNLHRQVGYRIADLGEQKVTVAAKALRAIDPALKVHTFAERLSPENLSKIFQDFDFVIDGTDRISCKYLINDGAVLAGLPFSHAGVTGLVGQTFTVLPRKSACLRCIFPIPPAEGEVPTCQEAGVIGALAGSIGLLQAAEAVKVLLGIGEPLANRLLTCDAGSGRWRTVALSRDRDCPVCSEQSRSRSVEPAGFAAQCSGVASARREC